jgi:hypothetical protein
MKGKKQPKLLSMDDIASELGWPLRQVRRILVKAGVVSKIGQKWYTDIPRIRTIYPEIADALSRRN